MSYDDKEWRVIPEFPNYEMTFDGEVRTVAHKAVMHDHYVGDDTEKSVALWREGGLVDKNIRNLIYETYPELKSVSPEARLELIRRFAEEMQHWLGGERFLYEEFEQLADIVIEEGWTPNE